MGKNIVAYMSGLGWFSRIKFVLVRTLEASVYFLTQGSFGASSRFYQAVEEYGCTVSYEGSDYKVGYKGMSYLMRRDSSDYSVFVDVILKGEYDLLIDLATNNGIDVETIVDAGANCGYTALKLAGSFSEAQLYCFEPDPENYRMLERNMELNKCGRAKLYQAALSALAGWVEPVNSGQTEAWGKQFRKVKGSGSIMAYSLDELVLTIENRSIDILKMDIEGAEEEIFSAVSLDFLTRTKLLAVEVHSDAFRPLLHGELKKYNFLSFGQGSLVYGINKGLI